MEERDFVYNFLRFPATINVPLCRLLSNFSVGIRKKASEMNSLCDAVFWWMKEAGRSMCMYVYCAHL